MSFLSNTCLYSLLGEIFLFFPDQTERKELVKDVRITGSGIVVRCIHDNHST